ncbi:AMP-binding protein [Streptomyces sp. NPDC057376]|uniref:AMP-binding protein n=1 Tax=Streptomyces sp. NPDC057376 TaxID=3346110 RepID=UPI0036306F64
MKLVGVEPVPSTVQARYVTEGWWSDAPLRDGLEAQADRGPDRVAVSDATSRWTYGRMHDAVARAVACLRQRVPPGTAVLVIAPLIAPAVVAYHAIIRTGALAVMLDRRCGRSDVEHALAAAPTGLIVTTPELAERLDLAGLGVDVVDFDSLVHWHEGCSDWDEPDPSGPAAVVFTSGTTSRPKAVVHSLRTLRAGARNMADALGLTADDAAFLSTPLATITGLVQIHLTLDRGAGLVLEDRFDPAAALDRLRKNAVTVIGGAPVIMEELFKEALSQDLAELPLRAVSLGGAPIPRSMLELGMTRYGITPVRVYGSSEVPVATTTMPGDEGESRVVDDGACAGGTEVRILGGGTGEILVRGPMRCLGYGEAEDNRHCFLEGGWYRTGDLGRFENGRLTVTGRLKEIVSRKGLKISLTEIDEVARDLPHAEEVAAYGVPDPDTGERLALAVFSSAPEALSFDSVVDRLLASGLAKWKLPEQIVVWDRPLPRTETGKIQRRLVADDPGPHRTLLAPRLRVPVPNTLEELMSPAWLSSALGDRFPGVRVGKVTPGPVVSRVSTNARFRIECDEDLPGGLSPHLCAKGYFTDAGRPTRQSGVHEVSFYRELAASTGVRTLRSVYADVDPKTRHGVVITEDVIAQGGSFLTPTSDYSPQSAAESLSQLAKLHAATWNDPALAATPWLAPRLAANLVHRGVSEIRGNFASDIGAGVPGEVRDAERLFTAYRALVEQVRDTSPWSVIHGDPHVGNTYLDADGRPSLLDWQLVQCGPWYLDVGYHIASVLTVEDRRRHEKDLLRHYLGELRAGGVEAPASEEAWRSLPLGILHGLYLWSITLLVEPPVRSALLHRLGTAAADHDAYAAVGA